jgi:O-antigen ligase
MFGIFALVGFFGPLKALGLDNQEGSLERFLNLGLYGVTFSFSLIHIAINRQEVKKVIGKNITAFLFLSYVSLSVLWSPMIGISLPRLIQLLGMMSLSMSIVILYQPSEFSKLLRYITATVIIISITFMILFPSESLMPGIEKRYRGPFDHANYFGQMAILAITAWFGELKLGRLERMKMFAAVVIGFSLLCIWLSDSATSIVLVSVVLLVAFILMMKSSYPLSYRVIKIVGIFILFLCFAFGIFYGPELAEDAVNTGFEALGRNAELTGRLPLWSILILNLPESNRLLFGYGFGGFWNNETGPASDLLYGMWTPSQAHNGYLDVMIQLGIVGLVFFIWYIIGIIKNTIEYVRLQQSEWFMLLTLILVVILQNFSETTFLRIISPLWIIFITCSLYVSGINSSRTSLFNEPASRL